MTVNHLQICIFILFLFCPARSSKRWLLFENMASVPSESVKRSLSLSLSLVTLPSLPHSERFGRHFLFCIFCNGWNWRQNSPPWQNHFWAGPGRPARLKLLTCFWKMTLNLNQANGKNLHRDTTHTHTHTHTQTHTCPCVTLHLCAGKTS